MKEVVMVTKDGIYENIEYKKGEIFEEFREGGDNIIIMVAKNGVELLLYGPNWMGDTGPECEIIHIPSTSEMSCITKINSSYPIF